MPKGLTLPGFEPGPSGFLVPLGPSSDPGYFQFGYTPKYYRQNPKAMQSENEVVANATALAEQERFLQEMDKGVISATVETRQYQKNAFLPFSQRPQSGPNQPMDGRREYRRARTSRPQWSVAFANGKIVQ